MSYIDVPEFVIRNCPLCGRASVLAAKGCNERRYRIYCSGMMEKPVASCERATSWWHVPEAAEIEWNSDRDVPLPLFPDEELCKKTG